MLDAMRQRPRSLLGVLRGDERDRLVVEDAVDREPGLILNSRP
jgi:hypothetical protein